ncbi:hypothetical protein HCN44_002532 [Aphidius gifuensis]|uniref:Aromatic amino acid beta-eliminating lyase/threonine aldolase domain-containing protein n=2 Tax=Aphidius gifuensis TaxID=684658 RepID=A0A834Y5J0_APHGI|nr:probable low-specificity L-threonine aldolase 2 isoform X2 [Aphidius gifuensis]XP_044020980.1 probable low-specificity L-threonine aldolase 2 isoform X2 [Aphidius gifuensis]XP_044020981.1 probable low-specificity L-threonine aldolase 2 isoform X2 [Aphidius gifuensis]KAF7996886.1 hypothetical protein HCN44_002532 [Aphidius gifuensis]
MSYGETSNHRTMAEMGVNSATNAIIVDLRSDTITKPCLAMRQAMFSAEVGDDVCEEDPTVINLEKTAANLLGKEASLFVTSGTMGNLISIMVHCNTRGCEIYVGEDSHIVAHEQGGSSQIAGVILRTFPNNPDGTFDLNKVKEKIHDPSDAHYAIPKMIAIENTISGKALPMSWINQVVEFAKKYNLKLHMDGARLFNAVTKTGLSAIEITRQFDSVTFCLSKGLGAPVGSMLCGSKEFIKQARRVRKVLGGGMRQSGVLAAAGLIALENRFKLNKDHEKAKIIMDTINNTGSSLFKVYSHGQETNMVLIYINNKTKLTAKLFAERLGQVIDDDNDDKTIIKAWSVSPEFVRLVFHLDINDEMLIAAQKKITYLIKKYDTKCI